MKTKKSIKIIFEYKQKINRLIFCEIENIEGKSIEIGDWDFSDEECRFAILTITAEDIEKQP